MRWDFERVDKECMMGSNERKGRLKKAFGLVWSQSYNFKCVKKYMYGKINKFDVGSTLNWEGTKFMYAPYGWQIDKLIIYEK